MADDKTLTVFNHLPDTTLLITVSTDGWNCCDAPIRGQDCGSIAYNNALEIPYVKKGGHGCDGSQGQFTINVYSNSNLIGNQAFDFDSGGGIEAPIAPFGFKGVLTGTPAGANYVISPA